MAIIQIQTYNSTRLSSEYDDIKTVEIADSPMAGGTFGDVFECLKVNGKKPQKAQLVKVFKYAANKNLKTIKELQSRLKDVHEELVSKGSSLLEEYQALEAVPQFSFKGTLQGERVQGFSANDLNKLGYIEYSKIIDEDDQYEDFFYNYDIVHRYKIGYTLIKTMDKLSRINYIHADFKDSALFIDKRNATCAVIDFDSGAIFDNNMNNSQPTTIGELQDWLAPEIFEQLGNQNSNDLSSINVNIFSDTWSVTVALYHLILGEEPYCFIAEQSPKNMKTYSQQNRWPNIDVNSPLIDIENIDYIEYIQETYHQVIPPDIKKAFEVTFNDGYFKPSRRYSYEQWVYAFQSVQGEPEIVEFKTNIDHLNFKQQVTLTWNVTGAFKVFINGHNVSKDKDYKVSPNRDSRYELVAENVFGKTSKKELNITVSKEPPEIIEFKANEKVRNNQDPIILSWETKYAEKIMLYPDLKDVTSLKSVEVFPVRDTLYFIEVESFFGVKKALEIKIEVSKEPPLIHSFSSDKKLRTDKTPIQLSWEVSNTKKLVLQPGNIDISNKRELNVKPVRDTNYSLVAESFFGVTTSEELEVLVSKKPPTITEFSITPEIRKTKKPSVVKWNTVDAEKVTIFPLEETLGPRGSVEVTHRRQTEYIIEAESMFGVTSQKKLLGKVHDTAPKIEEFRVRKPIVKKGTEITLVWNITGADKVLINNQEKTNHTGSMTLKATKRKVYKLVAESYFGAKVTREVTLWVLRKSKLKKIF
jgi:serine/threonine protein kinase